jgi:Uma2 family endonuclease
MVGTRLRTVEELEQMPNEEEPGRYDLIDGELFKMPPPGEEHGDCIANIFFALSIVVRSLRIGKVYTDTGFVLGRRPDQVVSPDVAFVRSDRLDPDRDRRISIRTSPDFAVEIVSPSDYPLLVQRKIDKYLAAQVPLLWVVYPEQRSVHAFRLGVAEREFVGDEVLDAGDVIPGFSMRVSEIFA